MAIFHAFAPPLVSKDHDLPFVSSITDEEASARFLMLSPLDIASLVQVLCPDRTPSQDSTERASTIPLSDPPSTAGSSTLVPESSDVGSTVTLSATHPTTIDIVPSEASVPKTCVDSQDSPDLHGGDLKAETKSKEASSNDPFFELKRSCQKLKDVSSRNTSASPESFSKADSWAFVYYSKDGSKLSVESIGIEGPDTALPDFASSRQHDKIRARADERDSYASLKVAMVGLLYEGDGPNTETVEPATVTGAFGHPDPFEALETLMKAAMDKAHSDLDFASAHVWWRKLQIYQDYLARHSSKSSRTLFHDIARDLQGAVNVAADIGKHCEAQCRSLGRLQKCNKSMLARMDELRNALRVKMWYVSDVRHSATYEESLYVTRALRTMASSKRPKQPGSISSWARQRLRGTNIHDRAEAQTLEAMVAPKEHGGLSKLADEQVELTSRWLTRKSIENFCKGEERIHRFCYEVQRSIGRIAGVSLLESPVLWSSNLFRREKASFDSQRSRSNVFGSPFTSPFVPPAPFEPSRLHTPISAAPALSSKAGPAALARSPTNTFGGLWSASHPRRQPTGLGLQGNPFTLPPTPTSPPMSWSNNPFGPNSPLHGVTSTLPSYSNPSAGHSRGNSEGEVSQERKAFAEQTKKTLCSLMVSDLGYLLWNQGSETDTWVNDHSELLESEAKYTLVSGRAMSSEHGMDKAIQDTSQQDATLGDLPSTKSSFPLATPTPPNSFPFKELYTTLLRRMSLTHDPYTKLRLLYELEDLIVKSMDSPMPTDLPPRDSIRLSRHYKHPSLRSKSVPRTKANSLEEVIANCTERRAGTLKYKAPKVAPAIVPSEIGTAEPNTSSTDDIVNTLYTIFRDPTLRPQTLFRDLQYIAAFIPASTLDQTAHGKAFWDAGLAALALKEDLCDSMVRHANTITAYHISPRASLDPAADNAVAATTLQDAANLWLVTAKEGSPVAARELGLFYLTHPELLPRVTMPFSKAKDVFRAVMANDTRVGDKEKGALDPYTFAVVLHWMEIAANGGDKDAGIFLRGNGELSGGR